MSVGVPSLRMMVWDGVVRVMGGVKGGCAIADVQLWVMGDKKYVL